MNALLSMYVLCGQSCLCQQQQSWLRLLVKGDHVQYMMVNGMWREEQVFVKSSGRQHPHGTFHGQLMAFHGRFVAGEWK